MVILHALRAYWAYVGSNVAAVPPCAALGFLGGFAFRAPFMRWWHRHFSAKAEAAEARDIITAAHQIIADLHAHVTGEEHPLAPGGNPPGPPPSG